MLKFDYKTFQYYLFIISFAGILFLPFIGQSNLFDWDEINFAEAAREMIVTGDYLTVRINYEPFHEKPPLFIITQSISMHIFGINEFAARFPNAVMGIITLLFLFNIGKKLKDEKFGFLLVIAHSGSILSHFYFKTAIIDPFFNFFMFVSIYYLYKSTNNSTNNRIILKYISCAGIYSGLAVLTKGPVGFGLVFVTFIIFNIIRRKQFGFQILPYILFIVLSISLISIWYILLGIKLGSISLIYEFISYQIRLFTTQDAGHGGPFYYHFIVLLFGMFPASVFAIRGIKNNSIDNQQIIDFSLWMKIIFLVVLIIFSIVNTKIVHYSSMAYFPIAFLAAKGIYSILYQNNQWKKSTNWLIGTIGILLGLFSAGLPLLLMNIDILLPRITDKFTLAILSGEYHWDGNEWIPGLILIFGIIIALIFFARKKILQGVLTTYGATTIFIVIVLPFLVPKIEQYTQLSPINFFKSLKGEDCYILNYGYKTYAHYFYAEIRPEQSRITKNMNGEEWEEWLINGKPDKPVYVISKFTNKEVFEANKNFTPYLVKNGWVVFYRP